MKLRKTIIKYFKYTQPSDHYIQNTRYKELTHSYCSNDKGKILNASHDMITDNYFNQIVNHIIHKLEPQNVRLQ